MARLGMVIDTRKCVGCMDCVVACQTENDVPAGYCRDWIVTEVRGDVPAPHDGDPLGALQPLRQPAVRGLLPDRREPRRAVRQDRAGERQPLHRLQGLRRGVPVRRALHPPEGLRRQVHVLPAPREGRQAAGVRRRSARRVHALRRPRRPEERGERAAAHAQVAHAAARGRDQAARVLPDEGTTAMLEITTTRAEPAGRSEPARLGLGDSGVPLLRRHGRRDDDPRRHGDAAPRARRRSRRASSRCRRRCSASC